MKVLLFTHKSDIDGMGNVVLARLAFDEVKYVLCETFNLQNEINKYIEDKSIYDYDMVFVTDLWLMEPMTSTINNDELLKGKFFVFDHHESVLEEDYSKYSFVTIRIEDEHGLCSGTSLFYEYLINSGYLDKNNNLIYEFSELTRKYDTWEWKTKYNDEVPHKLTLLFDSVGCEGYIKLMYEKLCRNDDKFQFNKLEEMLIDNKISQVQEKLKNYSNKIHYKEILGLTAGIVFIDYKYRNDLAEYFRQGNYDMDFGMFIAMDYGTVSYRNIKEDVNVRLIAEAMGGKGHDKAAASPISNLQLEKIIEILSEIKN